MILKLRTKNSVHPLFVGSDFISRAAPIALGIRDIPGHDTVEGVSCNDKNNNRYVTIIGEPV